MSPSLLRSFALPSMMRRLRQRGVVLDGIFGKYGLDAATPDASEVTLALPRAISLAEECARLACSPHFGLETAVSLQRGELGLVEFAARTANTLREGLARLTRLGEVRDGAASISLEEHREVVRLVHRVDRQPAGLGRQLNEFAMAMFFRLALDITAGRFAVRRVQFAHSRSGPLGERPAPLTRVFGDCKFDFDLGESALVFERRWLDVASVEADPALSKVLQQQVERVARGRPPSDDLRASLRAAMLEEMRDRTPTLAACARRLATSDRTLQRRLAEEETSFQAEFDALRESIARIQVEERDKTFGEIAFSLRYGNLRAFARAYKRWTGKTLTEGKQRSLRGAVSRPAAPEAKGLLTSY